jgi:hypothetical protein
LFGKVTAGLLAILSWVFFQAFFGIWFGTFVAIAVFRGGIFDNIHEKVGLFLASVLMVTLVSTTGFGILRLLRGRLAAAEHAWLTASVSEPSAIKSIKRHRLLTFYVPLIFAACGLFYGVLIYLFLTLTRPAPFFSLDILATEPGIVIDFSLGVGAFLGLMMARLYIWETPIGSFRTTQKTSLPPANHVTARHEAADHRSRAYHSIASRLGIAALARAAAVVTALMVLAAVLLLLVDVVGLALRYMLSVLGYTRMLTWSEIFNIVTFPVRYWWAILLFMAVMTVALAFEILRSGSNKDITGA